MLKGFTRVLSGLVGIFVGYQLLFLSAPILFGILNINLSTPFYISLLVLGGLSGGIIFYLVAPFVIKQFVRLVEWVELKLQKMPATDIILGVIGLLAGLLIANLLSLPFGRLPVIGPFIPVLANIGFSYVGMNIAVKKKEDIWAFLAFLPRLGRDKDKDKDRTSPSHYQQKRQQKTTSSKILDTSVIIDGRIADVSRSGFLEGPLVIPNFILQELRHIADSSDVLKRNRGRRGLDILNRIQKEIDVEVIISDRDYDDVAEVDSKLLRLAQDLTASILTNDYNLNKVAELQGVQVLNINELANAVKPVVLPGEEMLVHVIKDGKETGQGVAYLDDGTMIVIDGGRRFIGDNIEVLVTSVLQTAAGRMIFAKPKPVEKAM